MDIYPRRDRDQLPYCCPPDFRSGNGLVCFPFLRALPFLLRLIGGFQIAVVGEVGRAFASRQVGIACRQHQFPANSAAVRTVPDWLFPREACPLRVLLCHVPVCIERKGCGDEAPRCRHSAQDRAGALPYALLPPRKIAPESYGLLLMICGDGGDELPHRSRRRPDGSRKRAGPV